MADSLITRLSQTPDIIVPKSRATPTVHRWMTPFENESVTVAQCRQKVSGGESYLGQTSRSASRSAIDIQLDNGRKATTYLVRFEAANAFRLLDARDTLPYWEVRAGIPRHEPEKTANSFIVGNAPWSRECQLLFRDVKLGESTHYVITDSRCVIEVISAEPPNIQPIEKKRGIKN